MSFREKGLISSDSNETLNNLNMNSPRKISTKGNSESHPYKKRNKRKETTTPSNKCTSNRKNKVSISDEKENMSDWTRDSDCPSIEPSQFELLKSNSKLTLFTPLFESKDVIRLMKICTDLAKQLQAQNLQEFFKLIHETFPPIPNYSDEKMNIICSNSVDSSFSQETYNLVKEIVSELVLLKEPEFRDIRDFIKIVDFKILMKLYNEKKEIKPQNDKERTIMGSKNVFTSILFGSLAYQVKQKETGKSIENGTNVSVKWHHVGSPIDEFPITLVPLNQSRESKSPDCTYNIKHKNSINPEMKNSTTVDTQCEITSMVDEKFSDIKSFLMDRSRQISCFEGVQWRPMAIKKDHLQKTIYRK